MKPIYLLDQLSLLNFLSSSEFVFKKLLPTFLVDVFWNMALQHQLVYLM